MDFLESKVNRPPLGAGAKILIGVLTAATIVAVAWPHVRQHDKSTASPIAGSSATFSPSTAASSSATAPRQLDRNPVLVGTHVEIATVYSLFAEGRDFVLTLELYDHDGTQPRVTAVAMPDHPGFERLALAVLPVGSDAGAPRFSDVASASHRPVTLKAESPAYLYIAGEVNCDANPAHQDHIDLSINGERANTGLPAFGGKSWRTTVAETACGRSS